MKFLEDALTDETTFGGTARNTQASQVPGDDWGLFQIRNNAMRPHTVFSGAEVCVGGLACYYCMLPSVSRESSRACR